MKYSVIDNYFNPILEHYKQNWGGYLNVWHWKKGPTGKLPKNFGVAEFIPTELRNMWTYATCGMSRPSIYNDLELHIFSPKQDKGLVELLTTIAYYHNNTKRLDLNHTVNFGRGWQDNSRCEYGLISLPFLDGPILEKFRHIKPNKLVKCYWLIPVTKEEVEYKKKFGLDALELRFEEERVDYINSNRSSII